MNDKPPLSRQPQEAAPNGGALRRLLRKLGLSGGEPSLKESLEEVIEEHAEDTEDSGLGADERAMLQNVLRYGELRIEDVMVPRADIVAVDAGQPFRDTLALISTAAHSRLPVYRGSLDDVVGMIHVKDVVRVINETPTLDGVSTDSLLRPVLFVPPSMKLLDVLTKMRGKRTHMAVVVDEYGGTDGLVTIEDLVEEIVGEIEDEHDEAPGHPYVDRGGGVLDVDARMPVPDIEQVLGCDLLPDERDEDIETLGGLVASIEGRVPEPGEIVTHPDGFRFEVLGGSPRRLTRVRIHPPETASPRRAAGAGKRD